MGYGGLTQEQRGKVVEAVKGRHVHDLGSGEGHFTYWLADHAKTVVGVDKERFDLAMKPNVDFVVSTFEDYDEKTYPEVDVAFLSWPANHMDSGLFSMVKRAKRIIYLGKNTDGTMCGFPELFRLTACRELEVHIPDPKNTLLILGAPIYHGAPRSFQRDLTGEEYAGLTAYDGPVVAYRDAVEFKGVRLSELDIRGTSRY
jgi:hypothetical protein